MEIPIAKSAYKKTFTFSFHSTLPTLFRKFVNAQPLYYKTLGIRYPKDTNGTWMPRISIRGGEVGA